MKTNKLSEKKWYNGAVIACIGVAFYVLLTNLSAVLGAVGTFIGYFRAVILAFVFAYVLNPLAEFFYYRLFKKMKLGGTRWTLSVTLAFLTALLVLAVLGGLLIPQFVQSVALLSENFDEYAKKLIALVENSALHTLIREDELRTLSENAMDAISDFLRNNASYILNRAADSGKQILSVLIAAILAIYVLMDKRAVLSGVRRLTAALIGQKRTMDLIEFALRCDGILVSYLSRSLLDSLIIGAVNAVIMAICRMQYVGLVSVVVAAVNLIPNFGPAIGCVIGGFILLLVNPWHALIFLASYIFVQFLDAYILKPKLFSGSLGVSGLLILAAGIVFGNMFGVLGVLLSIPAAAILSFLLRDYILPRRDRYWQRKQAERAEETQP